jgi:hypothetical protein
VVVGAFFFWGYIMATINYALAPSELHDTVRKAAFTTKGWKVFWESDPELASPATVNSACSGISDEGTFSGCWIVDEEYPSGKIFIHGSQDPVLVPEVTVTVAHEMLHAAYSSLSGEELVSVNKLLKEQLHSRKDTWFVEPVRLYKNEGQLSEAYALLGTSASNLPYSLSIHYDEYLEDREKLISYSHRLDAKNAELQALQNEAQAKLNVGDINGHNAMVDGINAKVAYYNGLVAKVNAYVGAR